MRDQLTAERLRSILAYNIETGLFTWLVRSRNGIKAGDITGRARTGGYLRIGIDGHDYFAHRLAWLHVTGGWPEKHIDHIDGRRDNNRFSNLRKASNSLNRQNQRRARSDSSTGVMGVQRHGSGWKATIKLDGRLIYLGIHASPEQAHAAYINAKRRIHVGNTI